MVFVERLIGWIEAVNEWAGRIVAWLTLGCVVVCFLVVVLRYAFSIGFVWMQELYVWQHALVFMIGAGYTFRHGGHVRVDVFYSRLSPRGRAWVDLFGTTVFLLPWLVILVLTSVPFITSSWRIFEWSQQADGLPGMFILKSAIWAFALLVGLQVLAIAGRSILLLAGAVPPDAAPEEPSERLKTVEVAAAATLDADPLADTPIHKMPAGDRQ